MSELNKIKETRLPYIIKDETGNAIGQITVIVNYNLTAANLMLNFQSETKVIENKDIIKQAYKETQEFFKQELINCGWDFLFDE